MSERRPLFSLAGALDRGRFVAAILFGLAALLTLALITLNGQTRGSMHETSFRGHLVLMLALMLWLIPLTLRRCFDLGWSVPKAWLAVIGSAILFPFPTLVFMALPGRTGAEGAVAPLPGLVIAAAPVFGVMIAMMVSVVLSRLS